MIKNCRKMYHRKNTFTKLSLETPHHPQTLSRLRCLRVLSLSSADIRTSNRLPTNTHHRYYNNLCTWRIGEYRESPMWLVDLVTLYWHDQLCTLPGGFYCSRMWSFLLTGFLKSKLRNFDGSISDNLDIIFCRSLVLFYTLFWPEKKGLWFISDTEFRTENRDQDQDEGPTTSSGCHVKVCTKLHESTFKNVYPVFGRTRCTCWSILTHPGKVTDIDAPHSSCCDGPNALHDGTLRHFLLVNDPPMTHHSRGS